jgi:hypothetical protein
MSKDLPSLHHYDAACRALARAVAVDEVKDIRDVAIAMRVYAHQAKNREAEANAVELRMRATRRLGEMIEAQKETVGLNTGTAGKGRPAKGGLQQNPPKDLRPTLASQGIDKNLAHQARALGALSNQNFEAAITDARNKVTHATDKVVAAIDAGGKHKRKPPREKAEHAALKDGQTKQRPRAAVARLVRTWVEASPEVKREFVRERWDEIARVRKQLDANGADYENRWMD